MKTVCKSTRFSDVRYEVRGVLAEEAERLEARGENVIRLNIGNPASFGITAPPAAVETMSRNSASTQGYSNARGTAEAVEAILAYAKQKKLPNVTAETVFTGNGVSELIQMSLDALLNPGDEILIPTPDYPLWTAAATFAGGRVVHYNCDEASGWYPDTEDMERKVTDRTKAIVIINPNNPSGAIYPREILEEIAGVARRHDLVIFSDEIYDRLITDGTEHISIGALAPDVLCVTMNGLSKSHMLCGYRVGWMMLSGDTASARDYINGIATLADMRLCSNVPGQSVIANALSDKQRAEEYFIPGGRIYEQTETAWRMLQEIPGVTAVKPRAAFYIFPRLDIERFRITDDRKFALDLLREKKVLIVPGSGFNWAMPDHFRMVCLPQQDVMSEAVTRIGDFLENYRQN